jgi:short-subunit dehydrogenase
VLINNAGVFIPGALAEEEDGHLELMVETNLYSAYYLTRALLPSMLKRRKGHIFNMCSIASLHAYPNGGSYSISKYALLGFSKNLREETKDQGIRVSSIMPGATWSASWEGVDLPEERLMKAEDVAIAVWSAWSMSPQAVMEDIVLRPQLGRFVTSPSNKVFLLCP